MSGARGKWRPVQSSANDNKLRGKWRTFRVTPAAEEILNCTLHRCGWRPPENTEKSGEVKR